MARRAPRMSAQAEAAGHVRLAVLLGLAGALASACVFPYLLAITPGLEEKLRRAAIPIGYVVAGQSAQGGVMLGLLSWAGLRLGAPLGLDAPLLRRLVYRQPVPAGYKRFGFAIALGIAAAVAVAALDVLLRPYLPERLTASPPGAGRLAGFLAAFYGSIAEEIEMRLFAMSAIAWVAWRLARRPAAVPAAIYWIAIVAAALLFGAGHLPLALRIWGPDAVTIARIVALDALPGVAFGWLFWKWGLEQAMVAHFAADLVLRVVFAG